MGARGEDAPKLSSSAPARGWPLVVRRATESDNEQVLAFATRTWHDWDYIPNAWPVWLAANDGAFLVGTVGEPLAGVAGGALDAEGNALTVGQVVALTRVAMLSESEAWLEGIRVDPRVRGMGVAADLQVAELQWISAQPGVTIVRYATGAANEASHRLGARDGINLVARLRAWWWSATGSAEHEDDEPSAFDVDVRAEATARRQAALEQLAAAGLIVGAAGANQLWRMIENDPTFAAAQRLYEPRSWAMQELTAELLHRHALRGEVVAAGDGAVAILVGEQLPSEDSSLRLAFLCGDGAAAAALVEQMHETVDQGFRFRVPVDAPMITGHEDLFRAAGFVTPDWELHLLAREMDEAKNPIPAVDPGRVLLAQKPAPIVPPRW